MVVAFAGVIYHVVVNVHNTRTGTVVGVQGKGMRQASAHFCREDVVVLVALHGTDDRVVRHCVVGLADKRNLQVSIL